MVIKCIRIDSRTNSTLTRYKKTLKIHRQASINVILIQGNLILNNISFLVFITKSKKMTKKNNRTRLRKKPVISNM